MAADLEIRTELYLLDKGGQIVFFYTTATAQEKEEQSKLLTASYLTGVLQFARKASGDIISTFELGKSNIILRQGTALPLYYVLIVGKGLKLKEKQMEKILEQIIQEFEATHSIEAIKQWNGDIYAFQAFTETVKRILKVK